MSERLTTGERDERWAMLRERLLSGRHPEHGDPLHARVAVAVYEPSEVHDPAFLARMRAAMAVTGGRRLFALGFEDDGGGGIAPGEAFALGDLDEDGWSDAGFAEGWAVNGVPFVFTDETARWAIATVVDVQVVGAEAALVRAFWSDDEVARDAIEAFRRDFDTPDILPSFRAMAGRARLP